jgi:hypothetical protein
VHHSRVCVCAVSSFGARLFQQARRYVCPAGCCIARRPQLWQWLCNCAGHSNGRGVHQALYWSLISSPGMPPASLRPTAAHLHLYKGRDTCRS